MKINIISYLIEEGFSNIFKYKKTAFSSILIMCILMIILGIFFTLGENVNHIMDSIEDAQAIQVNIKIGTDEQGLEKLKNEIKAVNGVNSVKFIPKEETLNNYQEKLGDKGYILESMKDDNFFPDAYMVTLTDLKLMSNVEEKIKSLDNVKSIVASNQTVTKLISITNVIRILTAIIAVGLIIGSIFIISNTIKLTVYARRKEISIMKYVGATDSFIRWPFIIEGIIIGIISSAISILVIGFSYKILATKLLENETIQKVGISLVGFNDMFTSLILIYLIIGLGIGILGSIFSMKKYLEV